MSSPAGLSETASLLCVPREIRLMILRWLLRSSSPLKSRYDINVHPREYLHDLYPQILSTCRTLHAEGSAVLYTENAFEMTLNLPTQSYDPYVQIASRCNGQEISTMQELPVMRQIKHLRLLFGRVPSDYWQPSLDMELKTVMTYQQTWIRLCQKFDTLPNLRSFHIQLPIWTTMLHDNTEVLTAVFAPLRLLPKRIEIKFLNASASNPSRNLASFLNATVSPARCPLPCSLTTNASRSLHLFLVQVGGYNDQLSCETRWPEEYHQAHQALWQGDWNTFVHKRLFLINSARKRVGEERNTTRE